MRCYLSHILSWVGPYVINGLQQLIRLMCPAMKTEVRDKVRNIVHFSLALSFFLFISAGGIEKKAQIRSGHRLYKNDIHTLLY